MSTQPVGPRHTLSGAPALTARQLAVLTLIGEGHSNRAIAEALGISENGVKAHVSRLLAKFKAPNRAALVQRAHQNSEDPVSTGDVILLLRSSLEDVIGVQASTTLIRRAAKRAHLSVTAEARPEEMSMADVSAVVRELWPLLIEMTGEVLVRRLKKRGFGSGGEIDVGSLLR